MRRLLPLLLALPLLMSRTSQADEPTERSAELQVLDKFVGTWEIVVTAKPTLGQPMQTEVVSTRTWSRGGTHLHFNDTGGEEISSFLTYDAESKQYTGSIMVGSGVGSLAGVWDAETNTMRFQTKYTNGYQYEGEHRFVTADKMVAEGVVKDPEGTSVLSVTFKQVRRQVEPE